MIIKIAFCVLGLSFLASCTNAGPFVMAISSNGENELIIEKCNVKLNSFMGTISNENCTTTQIKLK